jgi:hypothetical protein
MSNLEEDSDDDENVKKNLAKIEINAWRKRRSIINGKNPLLQRRLSQGETMTMLNYSSTLNRLKNKNICVSEFTNLFSLVILACRDRLVRTPTVIVCKNDFHLLIIFFFIFLFSQGYGRITSSRQSKNLPFNHKNKLAFVFFQNIDVYLT